MLSMKRKRQKPRNKPYFCHDENLEFLTLRKICSKSARFIGAVEVTKKQGEKDPVLIRKCNEKDYHILTHNTVDFRSPLSKIKVGIICIGLKDEEVWMSKFSKMLRRLQNHADYYHKTIYIENIIRITDRRTGEIRLI
ncbi:MAG: hypothetical protein UT63_C0073G0015 [Candidatus Gottesmanbacteria bacterium GW2011_GWC2_39_8]|uniref:DUF5615 domain-containing protein n=1 Tax=Candidatus Gottesmanbacteria bacterium GW2011_GWC2_39_8 TaxID=1618450 RepID=A0A0G0PT50_9BACT|nr:MAG: hypothetical protein UT63_C0073G0015 [Candidatus Gottesmanbacteria bacterium GW2011_GWC2_39_8]